MSFFLILLVIGKKNKTNADRYLAAIFTVYGLTIGGAYIETFNLNNGFPFIHLMNVSWLFLLLHGPFLWFYVKSLTNPLFRFRHYHLLHFIPFLLFSIFHFSDFIRLSADEKLSIIQNELFRDSILFRIAIPTVGISNLTYNIVALFLLQKHRVNIQNQFSNIEDIDLKWLRTLVIAALVIFGINIFLFNLNTIKPIAGYYEISGFAYAFASVYVLYLGFFGVRQGKIFSDYSYFGADGKKVLINHHTNTVNDRNEYSETISKLTRLMEYEQPYMDPEINLAKLSGLMQIKPELLSEVLNTALQQNFYDFINKHRIEEFKIQCLNKDKKHLSILGLAYECGFNSKAAFYRAFSKFEGTSPTEYISKVSK